ncbi:7122_t:CDS:2 [Funneliformis geosporum]|nr:7122_t:CDS:2 [Funneliformis geosporum]
MKIEFSTRDVLIRNVGNYDVKIYIGQGECSKMFWAHTVILRTRCEYFKIALSNTWATQEDGLIVFVKPNIHPTLCFIEEEDGPDVYDLLFACDELMLHELAEHIQEYLIQRKPEWMNENLVTILRSTWLIPTCNTIKQLCIEKICDDPWLLFASDQFYRVEEEILIAILQREDLNLPEVYIWNNVIKWATAQLDVELDSDVSKWNLEDFALLKGKMNRCLLYIRLNNIDMEEYYRKVRPFKNIFSKEMQERIEEYYFTGRKLDIFYNPRLPFIIDSCLIKYEHAALIAHWINRGEGKVATREKNPFNFRLLVRGSDHGFCGEVYDRIRFEYPALLVLILTESDEMIGGYQRINSNYWRMFGYDYDRESFLFRINRGNVKRSVISRVVHPSHAVYNQSGWGPCFGEGDLWLKRHFRDPTECVCKKASYEARIAHDESFIVREYEIFEVTSS